MRHLTDPNLIAAFALTEAAPRKMVINLMFKPGDYGVPAAEDAVNRVTADAAYYPPDDELPDPSRIVAKIYGIGGWNRYIVNAEGEVLFSAFHADAEATERASRYGFAIFR